MIGVNEYKSYWNQLTTTRKDADRVRDYLIDRADFDLVITLTNERASKERIRYLMEDAFPTIVRPKVAFFLFFWSWDATF